MKKEQQLSLTDFPAYIECRDAVRRAEEELQKINDRRSEIEATLLSMKRPAEDVDDEWDIFEAGGSAAEVCVCTSETELKEEYRSLEEKEKFLNKALTQGKPELDRIHGRCSLEICQAYRPLFVEQVRKILKSLKAISEANIELETLRSSLRDQGVATGSLASATFDIGGEWSDKYGGPVVDYQTYIVRPENYPELIAEAGQDIALKRRELATKSAIV